MAGPTFEFWYEDFDLEQVNALAHFIDSISKSWRKTTTPSEMFSADLYIQTPEQPTTGTICVYVKRWRERYDKRTRSLIREGLGFVPQVELSGYCMANQISDGDGLKRLATFAAQSFGGWVEEWRDDDQLPDLPGSCTLLSDDLVEIVFDDVDAFFGPDADAQYRNDNRRLVPKNRYWFIGASHSPTWWVLK